MSLLTLIRGTFAELKAQAMPVRIEVFVNEQKVPVEIEQDKRDPMCIHVLASLNDQPIGTGRIDLEAGGKIGRIAVLKNYRHQSIGKQLMIELELIARENSLQNVYLNSQMAAAPFYESLGYSPIDEQFSEAGIEHIKMVKRLG